MLSKCRERCVDTRSGTGLITVVCLILSLPQVGAARDLDQDGVAYGIEVWAGTDPLVADTDGDGILDGDDLYPLDAAYGGVGRPVKACRKVSGAADPEFEDDAHLVTWQERGAVYYAEVKRSGFWGEPTLVDFNAVPMEEARNGPEWMVGNSGPEILYSKHVGLLRDTWVHRFRPGGLPTQALGLHPGVGPYGTVNPGDPDPYLSYVVDSGGGLEVWVRRANADKGPGLFLGVASMSEGAWRLAQGQPTGIQNVVGAVYVPRTGVNELHTIDVTNPGSGWQQITTDGTNKYQAHQWFDPVSGHDLIMTMRTDSIGLDGSGVGPVDIALYQTDGTLFQVITTQLSYPYIVSPEPFVATDGRSYIAYLGSAAPMNFDTGETRLFVAEVARSGGNPDPTLSVRRLDDSGTTPTRWKDPEAFVYDGVGTWVYVKNKDGGALFMCDLM